MTGADPGPQAFEGIDRGLAAERTDMAWSRSGLSIMVCGLAALKALPALREVGGEPLAGAVLLALGAAVWLVDLTYRRRRWRVPGRRPAPARYGDVAPVAYGTAAIGIVGVVLVLVESV